MGDEYKVTAEEYRMLVLSGSPTAEVKKIAVLSDSDIDSLSIDMAKDAHGKWMAAKSANGWRYGPKTDSSSKTNQYMVEFEKLPDEIKESNIHSVNALMNAFRSLGLNIISKEDLVKSVAAYLHDSWAKDKFDNGWRYGPKRDDGKKIHNDLLPFELLSDEDQSYDLVNARSIIDSLFASGYMLV